MASDNISAGRESASTRSDRAATPGSYDANLYACAALSASRRDLLYDLLTMSLGLGMLTFLRRGYLYHHVAAFLMQFCQSSPAYWQPLPI
jgi:hypothetical protein